MSLYTFEELVYHQSTLRNFENHPRNFSIIKIKTTRESYSETDLGLLQHPRWSAL